MSLISLLSLLSTLVIIVASQNNDAAVYFPAEDGVQPIPQTGQRFQAATINVKDLENLRGTSKYEKYVDDIIAKGISRLTVQLNKLLKKQTHNAENVLFSPISITNALALVLLGSNGITFKQISGFWGLATGIPDIDKKSQIVHEQFSRMLYKLNKTAGFQLGQEINVASALFVQQGYPIRPVYRSTAEDLYSSSIMSVDFENNARLAQKEINDWVAKKTNQRIKSILNHEPSTDTKVVLTSALYFKAEWEHHFYDRSTKRRPFYVDGRNSPTTVEADMMSNGGEFPYYKDTQLGCEVLGLPYKGNRSTMYIIMPFESSKDKLYEFESRITEDDLNNLVSKTRYTDAVLLFPRMKIETTIDLRESLKLMGVTSLFDPKQANLAILSSGHNPQNLTIGNRLGTTTSLDNIRQLINEQSSDNNFQNPGLYADEVIHKVYMDITEKGTEAAASTSVSLTRAGKTTFRVDVPFSFFIRHDETNTILFWGSVIIPNPSYKKL
ncbi:unnamed protein product [Ceutorhynchus assimilis]|uniref:Serpin domain-containing protein n=1 Tax=Ceutorhynchus assimilis TaxID=467358 RepID=A0A9N9MMP4_9CUCU|nr:unnamed protein product [Ceutorhynchus assimilis]